LDEDDAQQPDTEDSFSSTGSQHAAKEDVLQRELQKSKTLRNTTQKAFFRCKLTDRRESKTKK
jgi:hypothetical protein